MQMSCYLKNKNPYFSSIKRHLLQCTEWNSYMYVEITFLEFKEIGIKIFMLQFRSYYSKLSTLQSNNRKCGVKSSARYLQRYSPFYKCNLLFPSR